MIYLIILLNNNLAQLGYSYTVYTEKIIKNIRKILRWNPGRSIRELTKETNFKQSTVQRMPVNDLNIKSYKIIKLQLLSDATKKKRFERSKVFLISFLMARNHKFCGLIRKYSLFKSYTTGVQINQYIYLNMLKNEFVPW